MRLIPLAVAVSALANAVAADPVLWASRRGGWIEAFNLETLETVSRIRVPAMTESVASDPSGERLFVAAPRNPGDGCCALYALDPKSLQVSFLVYPALSATVTAGRLFTQRGNVGIEVFDPQNLSRLPTVKAPSLYRLRASPDGGLLFGITNFPQHSLDLFDAVRGVMIATVPVNGASGAWLGQQYFLFTVQGGQAKLGPVNSANGQPGRAMSLSWPDALPDCQPSPYDMIASGSRLAIYGQFGGKGDDLCARPGGFVLADPTTGAVTERFAANLHFRQLVASSDGRYLYGLDVGSPAWARVRIVKIDAGSGQVIRERILDPDVWYLSAGVLLVP